MEGVEALVAVIGGISGAGPAPRLVVHPGAADQKAPRKAADPNAVPEKRAMLWHTAERRKVHLFDAFGLLGGYGKARAGLLPVTARPQHAATRTCGDNKRAPTQQTCGNGATRRALGEREPLAV